MTIDSWDYFMEDPAEVERLERKTDPRVVLEQARWAGLRPGMRVVDIGCGPGKTSSLLLDAVQPGGSVVGIDLSADRIAHARRHYARPGLEFHRRDYRAELSDLGRFDFVWCRFILEYHRSQAQQIVAHLDRLLAQDGVLCLVDLDHNCLSHAGLPERVDRTIREIVAGLESQADFDPYAGRRLYGHLADLDYSDIDVRMQAHHLIFGALSEADRYNWGRKVQVAARRSGCSFAAYPDGFDGFAREFAAALESPRRFLYTPAIVCRGRKA